MRAIGRFIALLFMTAAAAVLLHDVFGWYNTGVFHWMLVSTLTDQLLAALQVTQMQVQHGVPPWLWDNVLVYTLQLPAAPTLALPGLILLWETRPRGPRETRLD
jgi:hypothetical protein